MREMADRLGNLDELSLEELGGPPSPSGAPLSLDGPPTENSFADARLDAPKSEGLRSGGDTAPGPDAAVTPAAGDEAGVGLDLALVEGGAVIVSARDKSLGKRQDPKDTERQRPQLEARGATAIAAPSFGGPTPAGHIARPRGLFAFDPVTNALAAVTLALFVAALPAFLFASSHANSDEVEAALEQMRSLRMQIVDLTDPGRKGDGPQGPEAVALALTQVGSEIEAQAAIVDDAVDGAKLRFWSVWLGLGVPLAAALALLKRKP